MLQEQSALQSDTVYCWFICSVWLWGAVSASSMLHLKVVPCFSVEGSSTTVPLQPIEAEHYFRGCGVLADMAGPDSERIHSFMICFCPVESLVVCQWSGHTLRTSALPSRKWCCRAETNILLPQFIVKQMCQTRGSHQAWHTILSGPQDHFLTVRRYEAR